MRKETKTNDRELKIKKEIEKFINPTLVSIDDMDRFEQREMKKKIAMKRTHKENCRWFYKDKFVSLFKTNTPENYCKNCEVWKETNQIKNTKTIWRKNIIKNIRNLFRLNKENAVIKGRIF